MEQEKIIILDQLNEVLSTKSFSDPVKEKIINTISKAYDSYSKTKKKSQFFEQLIGSLSSVNEFRISTRKQLNKQENIAPHLSNCTLGFVTLDRSLVGIVKEFEEENTIYHEMIHLTQTDTSYYVNEKYPFSKLVSLCFQEGEAAYYDSDLLDPSKGKRQEILSNSEENDLIFSSNSNYPFFSMIYKSFLELFGEDVLEKWKGYKTIDEDIIPILKEKFENKFSGTSFINFYYSVTKMIVEYFNKSKTERPKIKNYIKDEIKELKFENSLFLNNTSTLDKNIQLLKKMIQRVEEIDSCLNDDTILKTTYQNSYLQQQKELEEYRQNPECDSEIADEWQHDIEMFTIADYKTILKKELEDYKNNIGRMVHDKNILVENIKKQQSNYFCRLKYELYEDKPDFLDCYSFFRIFCDNQTNDFEIYQLSKQNSK